MPETSPLYRDIYDSIRDRILSGELVPGTKIPASRKLAEQLGVARMTVMNAYDQLFAEGYLEGKRGSGTFVARELPEEFLKTPIRDRSAKPVVSSRNTSLSTYGEHLRASALRISGHHGATNPSAFQHSLPALREFPFDIWSRISQQKYKYGSNKLGGYGDAGGYGPLRKVIAGHLRSTRGVICEDEQVIITAGTQQAMYLVARILLSRGDTVWLEDPCHLGARDVMESNRFSITHVPVDYEGFHLEAAKCFSEPAKLIYVTPSRQFPLGMTLSLSRRLHLIEWAKLNDAWIMEDDYDSEFRYSGRPLPSLQGLDRHSRVLYIGTFSKTIFPSLRLGCLVVPPDLVDIFAAARSLTDLHGPIVDQMVLTEFIADGHFERHIRRMRTLYRERQAMLVAEAQDRLGNWLEISPADAGMHLVGWLRDGMSDKAVSLRAKEKGVFVAPVSRYAGENTHRDGILLGYTAFDEREIKNGVRALAKVFEKDQSLKGIEK